MKAGTAFTRWEARKALRIIDKALESDTGWQLATESGAVNQIYAALAILDDYLANSKAIPLTRQRTREEVYAEQMAGHRSPDPNAVGAGV